MTEPLIDPSVLAELSDTVGADFAAELVATFLAEAPVMLGQLRQAAANGDADSFRRAAHSIKSNAEVFGAARLAGMARDMELGGLPETDAPLSALEATCSETGDALGRHTNG